MSLQKHDSLITMNLSRRNASLSITSLRKQWVGSLVYVWKESSKTRSTMYVSAILQFVQNHTETMPTTTQADLQMP